MRLKNSKDIHDFKQAISQCEGQVWLESPWGDRYNLKSELSQYIGVAELIKSYGDDLELFCQLPEDQHYFYQFFRENPEVMENK